MDWQLTWDGSGITVQTDFHNVLMKDAVTVLSQLAPDAEIFYGPKPIAEYHAADAELQRHKRGIICNPLLIGLINKYSRELKGKTIFPLFSANDIFINCFHTGLRTLSAPQNVGYTGRIVRVTLHQEYDYQFPANKTWDAEFDICVYIDGTWYPMYKNTSPIENWDKEAALKFSNKIFNPEKLFRQRKDLCISSQSDDSKQEAE